MGSMDFIGALFGLWVLKLRWVCVAHSQPQRL